MTSIPSPRLVLTDLINQIAALHVSTAHPPPTKKAHAPREDDEPQTPNPIKSLPLPAQDLLIALGHLLPDGIGPALDVLDRGLVTRYQLSPEKPALEPPTGENNQNSSAYEAAAKDIGTKAKPDPEPSSSAPNRYFYHVTSSELPPKNRGRYTKKFTPKVYTVRVGSWYCGCEAFTMAAFSGPPTSVTLGGAAGPLALKKWSEEEEERVWQHLRNGEWVWGGRMLGVGSPPICKHLVACVLAEHCGGLFMDHVKEVRLGFEGMVEKGVGPRTYEKVDNRTPVRIKQRRRLAEDVTGNGTG